MLSLVSNSQILSVHNRLFAVLFSKGFCSNFRLIDILANTTGMIRILCRDIVDVVTDDQVWSSQYYAYISSQYCALTQCN